VDFLNEFLRPLKVEKASLVGESLGGWIAALYVAEIGGGAHLVPVEKLVLVDAAGLKHGPADPGFESEFTGGDARSDGSGFLRYELGE